MVNSPVERALDPSLRVLRLPLIMIAQPAVPLGGGCGLPDGALEVGSANLILAATPCDAPLFRPAVMNACRAGRTDVLLVRTGLFPETMNPVTAEAALVTADGPLLFTDLSFARTSAGLWLVHEDGSHALEIRSGGLTLVLDPPLRDADERSDALCRAAAEIVRLSQAGAR